MRHCWRTRPLRRQWRSRCPTRSTARRSMRPSCSKAMRRRRRSRRIAGTGWPTSRCLSGFTWRTRCRGRRRARFSGGSWRRTFFRRGNNHGEAEWRPTRRAEPDHVQGGVTTNMDNPLKPGLVHRIEWTVGEEHAATHIGSGRVQVFATPAMNALMERTRTQAVQRLRAKRHTTVGIHVDVRDVAATPLGMRVTARAELVQVEKRVLTFRVWAEDEKERIGEGTHQRAIIDVAQFQEKVKA